MKVLKVIVNTPSGPHFHGEIRGKVFQRKVHKSKDLMRIYEAWSLHPRVLEKLSELDIKAIRYVDVENNELWVTNRKHWEEDAIINTFSGGQTLYLPLKFWHKASDKQKRMF